jgi:GH24 family phage-related lysozyme (muramidase)
MNGNVIGEPFDEFVKNQINIRQSNQYSGYGNDLRTNDQLKYLNNRNAWVKLASSVSIQEGDTIVQNTQIDSSGQTIISSSPKPFLSPFNLPTQESLNFQVVNKQSKKLRDIKIENPESYPGSTLAEKSVLFNSLSSYNSINGSFENLRSNISNNSSLWNNSAYGLGGRDFGLLPPPGITGVQVDSINRGSIRKANITLKAHNKFQFDVIELLYLRLGFTMMLEWGWDKYLDNDGELKDIKNTIIEDKWFKVNNIAQLEMLGYIGEYRERYEGNYDGFFGKVSNFSWVFNPDGSYDITIDLITVGDIIESLKVNTFSKYSLNQDVQDSSNNSDLNKALKNTNVLKASTLNLVGYFLYKKIEEFSFSPNDEISLSSPNQSLKNFARYRDPNTNSTLYVRLKPTDNSNIGFQYYIRLDEFLSQLENLIVPIVQNGSQSSIPQISISNLYQENFISYYPNQISLDPKVCIFKPSLNSYGDIEGITFPEYLSYLDDYVFIDKDQTYGLLMNLYVNFEFIAGLLTSTSDSSQPISLHKFLQDLCNGINSALGNVNKLEPIIKDDYIVTIIDQTLSSNESNELSNVALEIWGYSNKTSNFVKDIKFISKITPQLASMISIGATAANGSTSEIDGTAFSKWSEGLEDRFTKEIIEPKSSLTLNEDIQFDESKYREEFSNFPPKNSKISRTFTRIFYTRKWEELKNQGEYNKDIRKITNPYYNTIINQYMDFDTFFSFAKEIKIKKEKAGVYKREELKNLINKNYTFYLANAFGGELNNVKTEELKFVPAGKTPTGLDKGYKRELVQVNVEITSPRYLDFNDTFISQGKGAYQNYIKDLNNLRYQTENLPSSEIGFIPLSFELTLDGISGIKIYNKLNIDTRFLPSNYPESLNFIITKVNHSISNNSWDTSLSTISIPKTTPYKFNSNATQTNNIQDFKESIRLDPKDLNTSNKGLQFIKNKEKFRSKAYDDKNPEVTLNSSTRIEGTLTIGYGFTNSIASKYLKDTIKYNTTITEEVADRIFIRIIREEYEKIVKSTITSPLTQYEFDALVSIAYNAGSIGDTSNSISTPLKTSLNNRDYQKAANIIPTYRTTQKGITNVSLQFRRNQEQQVFISGNYGF